jgi:hypothetical protein
MERYGILGGVEIRRWFSIQHLVARLNHLCHHATARNNNNDNTDRARLYERLAGWAQHEGQSLNAMTLELLEAALDAWDSVEAADTEAAAK